MSLLLTCNIIRFFAMRDKIDVAFNENKLDDAFNENKLDVAFNENK